MPRCISRPPWSKASHRYLPRRLTSPTVRPTSACGSTPIGQRSGLPTRTPVTRAPRIRSAKLSRVTSTSGSSGMVKGRRARRRTAAPLHEARGIITIGPDRMRLARSSPRVRAGIGAGRHTRIVFAPGVTLMPAFRVASGPVRAVARGRVAAGRSAGAVGAVPRQPAAGREQGRELEPRRAALLSAAARRDRAARRPGRHRLPADARRGEALEGRAAVQARDRDRAAVPRRRAGVGGRGRVAPGVARFAGRDALPDPAARRAQSHCPRSKSRW